MIKKLSLRMKVTLISTFIMIFISVILTIISVFNANYGFYSMLTAIDNTDLYDNDSAEEFNLGNSGVSEVEDDVALTQSNVVNLINPFSYGLTGYASIALPSSSIVANSTEAALTNSASTTFKYNAVIYMIIVIVIGAIFIYFILGKILEPVKRLSDEIEVINANKLSQRVKEYDSGDEISELATSFNNMLDRLDKAFESQKRFSSDAAHELKTPLTALKTNLDILDIDENPSEDEYKRIVSIFRKQTERMIELINNLFILSAQKDYDFNDKVDFNNIIEEILLELDIQIKEKELKVNYEGCNIITQGNKIMLIHSISNLIENAVKYNNIKGSLDIKVKEENKKYIITISDTGIGIDKDKAEHIFEPFYRVDKSRSRKVGGAGLGLAITRGIINDHGGDVEYYPNEKGGSTFKITLPIVS